MAVLDLGPDLFPCVDDEVTIGQFLGIQFSQQWYLNGNIIFGATEPFYDPVVSGTYTIEGVNGVCFVTGTIEVTFQDPPVPGNPDTLKICDDIPYDGFGVFDLTNADAQIIDGLPNSSVEYYTTLAAAQAAAFPIPDPTMFTNLSVGFDTVYARLIENTYGCSAIVPLNIQVNESPSITDPITDYFLCDNDEDGSELFDLRSKDVEILNTLVGVTLTYHPTQADAIAGTAVIINDTAFPSGNAVMWVRAENVDSDGFMCVTVGSFNLVLGTVPVFVEVTPYIECDDNGDGSEDFNLAGQYAGISGGNIALDITFHNSQMDADTGDNPIGSPYTSTGETVYVRIVDATTGCYGTYEMELVVQAPPAIDTMLMPLTYCDDDNDGFGEFDLTQADSEVTLGNPGGNLVVSYHYTLADAQNGVLPLSSPYLNDVPFSQLVYVRVVDLATGCYSVTTLELQVLESPLLIPPSPLVLCDGNNDGFEVFDLTSVGNALIAGLPNGPYTVGYYTDAAQTVVIANPSAYTNTSTPQQTIYIRVTDTVNGCVESVELIIEVQAGPVLNQPDPLEVCDDDNDGFAIFDLTDRTFQITGGDLSVQLEFFADLADFNADSPIVDPTMYVNTMNNQTIYIKARFGAMGCEIADTTITLDLIVNPKPTPVTPTPLIGCDTEGDGTILFDIASKTAEIIGGEPGVSVSYYETLLDAQLGQAPLASPYQNIASPIQVIWARAIFPIISGGSGCFAIVPLELHVLEGPEVPLVISDLVVCSDLPSATFDLTDKDDEIRSGGLYPLPDYTVSYHTNAMDAQTGANAIANPQAYNSTPPETIHVRLEGANACFDTGSFELVISLGPAIVQPTPLRICDDLGEPNDGIAEFDLTIKDDEITGGNPSYGVLYYKSLDDLQNDIFISPASSYVNTTPIETIYVRVLDSGSECEATTNFTISVTPNPVPGIPDALRACDTDGDGMEFFNLTDAAPQIQTNAAWVLTYHDDLNEAFIGGVEVVDATNYQNTTNPQIVYVRVTDPGTAEACFEIVELELIAEPLPDDSIQIDPLVACSDVLGADRAVFNLTAAIPDLLGPLQDPADYMVSFYRSDVEAIAGTGAIALPGSFENQTNPQEIWTRITHIVSGCVSAGNQSFELVVQDGATATDPLAPYVICDNLDPVDGIGEFDLTTQDAEILAGQDPLDYTVSYHLTQADAQAGTNAVSPVTAYQNEINPQLIYARVTNTSNMAMPQCYATAQLLLKVEQLPEIVFEGGYRVCVDAQGNPIPEEDGSISPPTIETGLDESLYGFMWEVNGQPLPEVGSSIVAVVGGTYTVTVTEFATGCSGSYSVEVQQSSPPLDFGAEVVSGAFAGEHVIEAFATGDGTYEFQLDEGPFQESGTFGDVQPGDHIITIRDIYGCGSVEIPVGVIDYPRFFTPNGDRFNNTWNIIGIANGDPTAKIYIFDRYGKLLKQISPLGTGWDGTYNGNPLPSSDYWFQVEYTENEKRKEFRGHFTLKR